MPHRPNGATGMLVRGGGVVVWFAGDTSLHPDMHLLPQLAGAPIDLALLADLTPGLDHRSRSPLRRRPAGRLGCRRTRPGGRRFRHDSRAALTSSHSAAAVSCGWVSGKTCSPWRTVTTRTHLALTAARA